MEFRKVFRELGLPNERITPYDILIIDCHRCGAPSPYDGGFTDHCKCCGYYNLADWSEEAITLEDHWERYWNDF